MGSQKDITVVSPNTPGQVNQPSQRAPDVLHVIDSRTGRYYPIPIVHNAINASTLTQIKTSQDENCQQDLGLCVYDPGLANTAVCASEITFVDGLKGTIQYRGYDIVDIVGKKTFLDTAHLLIWGHWPVPQEASDLQDRLDDVPLIEKTVFNVIQSFEPNSSVIGMIIAGLSAFQSTRMDSIPAHVGRNLYLGNMKLVDEHIIHLLGVLPQITAAVYCHRKGRTFTPPQRGFSYIENLMVMMGHTDENTGLPNPEYVERMERLWVLIADHEMTCSTAALLQTASSLPDVTSCMISALSALSGPLHGGAIEVAYKSFQEIGSIENVAAKIERVKAGKERLYGYGHRVYRVVDPRFTFIKQMLDEMPEEVASSQVLQVALEINRVASSEEYFTSRKLRPNADLFAAFVYQAMGFDSEFILALSLLSRTQGLMAHWREAMASPAKIWRPCQIYTGKLNH